MINEPTEDDYAIARELGERVRAVNEAAARAANAGLNVSFDIIEQRNLGRPSVGILECRVLKDIPLV